VVIGPLGAGDLPALRILVGVIPFTGDLPCFN